LGLDNPATLTSILSLPGRGSLDFSRPSGEKARVRAHDIIGRERNLAYYDSIAKQWHKTSGYRGGEFKRFVLNDLLLENIPDIEGQSLLELGAGNGYFMPLVKQKYSGKIPLALMFRCSK